MITKTNLKDVLRTLGFKAQGDVFQKSIREADLKVDFRSGEIIYPEYRGLKLNERQTCNFSRNENFVVFECVHRLLEKGYKPEHLELEPKWKVGRGASGGRADILVKDHENNRLLLVECKTPGNEFEKAWENTKQDGDQLFSYAQQIAEVQYLCLYTSDLTDNKIRIDQRIISHRDNQKILEQNTKRLSFANATDVKDRFAVWRDTYLLEHTESGIFEHNIQAYQIGKNYYTLAEDTKAIDAVDKEGQYHKFRTILRKHNIARRENAFEVLVNLFLCKLVDEEDNKTDLKFYWKGAASDNYFDFVDRLQDLYQKGMRKFLNEEISYISNEQIDSTFWTVRNKRNATKKQIQAYFRELKFFTNSAFSFLDTHNEKLFTKNAKVLLEIVQMWQGIRLKTDRQNQFLGDMFEYFLDNSIKQSEGQFFTPLPICKFIVASLPLSRMIEDSPEPIKAIDYACGSGHFLNEYAHQIEPLVATHGGNLSDYYSQIIGVEKEDRLAKVAKVAAYMHGQEQIKILDADALASHPDTPLASFDVLVANPPFAVEGFLHTLGDEDKKQYQLIQAIGQNSNTNTIQCFFIERIHHLLAPGGVVGVIVPSSILSNPDTVNVQTRELLLQYFDIVSIAELGRGTFGKTSTNTVVLFLRRKIQKPEAAEHYANRVNDFFNGDEEADVYQDRHLIHAYCNHTEVPYEQYIKLFTQTSLEPLTELLQYDVFRTYQQDFDESAKIKNRKNGNTTRIKEDEILETGTTAVVTQEQGSLIAGYTEQPEVITDLPCIVFGDHSCTFKFIDFPFVRGADGTQLLKVDEDRLIAKCFFYLVQLVDIPNSDEYERHFKYLRNSRLPVPPLDVQQKIIAQCEAVDHQVDQAHQTIATARQEIKQELQTVARSSYEMKSIAAVLTLEYGISLPQKKRRGGAFPVYGSNGVVGSHNQFLVSAPCIIVGRKGSAGEINWSDKNCTPIDTTFYVKLQDASATDLKFTYHMLRLLNLPSLKAGSGPGGINRNNVYQLQIPVPPLKIQQQLVAKLDELELEITQAQAVIEAATERKTAILKNYL